MKYVMIFVIFSFGLSFSVIIDPIIDIAGSGMASSEKGSEIDMENVVNVKTPGFKYVQKYSRNDPKTGRVVTFRKNYWGEGPIVLSGRNLDATISGKGFFTLREPSGRVLLTRDGRFEINADHMLVSVAGKFIVLSDEMEPIEVPSMETLKIVADGSLVDSQGNAVARLGVVDVDSYKLLTSLNNVFFYLEKSDQAHQKKVDPVVLRPNTYESSNVEYSKTLASMATSGKYAANNNLIQSRFKMMDLMIDLVNRN